MACPHKILLISLVGAIYIITCTLAAQTNTCLLQCMRDVLKCKRDESLGFQSEVECCEKYTLCYFLCQPDALTAPSCSSKGKRGSWNKREIEPLIWSSTRQIKDTSSEDNVNQENAFYV